MVRCQEFLKGRIMSDTILAHMQPSSGLGLFLKSLSGRIARYRAYRETLAELEALGAHELEDVGLVRGTIQEVAYRSVYGTRET
jgi:uncharacterized protein YjiS (DUF1127 family)